MDKWIEQGIQPCTDDLLRYLHKRGLTDDLISDLGLGVWVPPNTAAPDVGFRKKYASQGQALEGHLAIPIRSPLGEVIGLDTREVKTKRITGYRLPKSKWVPVWLQTANSTQNLWRGGRAWLVEGLFDLAAVSRVIPFGDAVFATQRAALTFNQATYLSRVCTGGVILAYDNDEAGKKGTIGWKDPDSGKKYYGAVDNLKKMGVPLIQVCRYLGKDPGEVWLSQGDSGLRSNFGRY